MKRSGFFVLMAFGLAASAARAQTPPAHYDLQDMNFDMWCQEERHLPVDRCDQRLPGDEQAFEDYRSKIERYEIPYLQERDKREEFNRDILNKDPVDNPTQPSTAPLPVMQAPPPK